MHRHHVPRYPDRLRLVLQALLLAAGLWGGPALAEEATDPPVQTLAEGRAAYEGGHYDQAMRVLRPLADAGNAQAQYYVGLMHEKGDGVDRDLAEAGRWYRRAADQGYAEAQYRLAIGYALGLGGLERDRAAAVMWLQRSAENGYHRAQKVLAALYHHGLFGLPHDDRKAEYWYFKATGKRRP